MDVLRVLLLLLMPLRASMLLIRPSPALRSLPPPLPRPALFSTIPEPPSAPSDLPTDLPTDLPALRSLYASRFPSGLPPSHLTRRGLLHFLSPPAPAAAPAAGEHRTYYFDGGSRGNPGPAACGWALYASAAPFPPPEVPKAAEAGSGGSWLGVATNNEAEYRGFLAALGHCLAGPAPKAGVVIRGDSELLVRQVAGRYKCSAANLKPLCEEAKRGLEELRGRGVEVRVEHVRREFNKRADEVANDIMDAEERGEGNPYDP